MTLGRICGWALVGVFALVPLNWARIWFIGEVPKDATVLQFVAGTFVCWAIAGALAGLLVVGAQRRRVRQDEEAKEMLALEAAPLSEISPSHALLKPGERAFAAVMASLKAVKTVGFAAGTTGLSVRVAKGVTLRSSGTRGHAVKGLVTVASGELVLTDRRVIFAGDLKSFALALGSLVNVAEYSNGIAFHDSKSSFTVETADLKGLLAFRIALHKVLHSQHPMPASRA